MSSDTTSASGDAAREHFERALRLLKQARLSTGREDRHSILTASLSELERVLACDPKYPGARTNLGYCLIELGRYGEAKGEIERSLEMFPRDVSALINYAVILQHNQRPEEAEACLRKAMLVDPHLGTTYRDLAYLLERRREYRKAADNLQRYLSLTPHADDERQVRSRILLLRQRTGWLELPDQTATRLGLTADLRWRAGAVLCDGIICAGLWVLTNWMITRGAWVPLQELPVFVSLAYLYHLVFMEASGRSLGKIVCGLMAWSEKTSSPVSPLAVRETLRLGPILLGAVIPFPWNLGVILSAFLLAGLSALHDRNGRTWYDRLTGTHVITMAGGKKWRILSGTIILLSLIVAVLWWLP